MKETNKEQVLSPALGRESLVSTATPPRNNYSKGQKG